MALIPNIGAEEGPQWPALLEKPAVAATVALWRHLFPAPHHLIGTADTTECWPESMGDRPQEAAFASGVPPGIYAFHHYSGNSAFLCYLQVYQYPMTPPS